MSDETRIHLECTDGELAELAYDVAYMVKARLASGPMDTEAMASTIAVAVVAAICARDPESTKHEKSRQTVEDARKLHRAQSRHDA